MFNLFSNCCYVSPTIVNLKSKKVLKQIEKELDVIIISYGGSCSNTLVDMLEENKIRCRSELWDKILCHCPIIPDVSLPIIYIFDHPVKAFRSMKARGTGFWDVNQRKLTNNKYADLSDFNLMTAMLAQFSNFSENIEEKNLLMFPTHLLFEKQGKEKLEKFLQRKELKQFPVTYIPPKSSSLDIDFFLAFSEDIKKVNSF